jgi:hypothetical protein
MSSPRQNKFALSKYISSGTQIGSPRSPRSYALSKHFDNNPSEIKAQPVQTGGTQFPKTEYTTDKINDMLEHYNEVPKNDWINLPIGTHIRYMKKSGDFKPGGFIRLKKAGDKAHFLLENVPFGSKATSPTYSSWIMNFDNVAKIFSKDKNAPSQPYVAPHTQPQTGQPQPSPIQQPQTAPYNPESIIENGMMQREIDELKKIVSENNSKISKLNEELADLTLVVRKLGKYLQTKGIDTV